MILGLQDFRPCFCVIFNPLSSCQTKCDRMCIQDRRLLRRNKLRLYAEGFVLPEPIAIPDGDPAC